MYIFFLKLCFLNEFKINYLIDLLNEKFRREKIKICVCKLIVLL